MTRLELMGTQLHISASLKPKKLVEHCFSSNCRVSILSSSIFEHLQKILKRKQKERLLLDMDAESAAQLIFLPGQNAVDPDNVENRTEGNGLRAMSIEKENIGEIWR